jgi:endonuclease/exonuclease/phosphatase family metal-dependent hydrolase
MRVMTYNIKGQAALLRGGHIENIAKVIADARPHVVGLQEIHRSSWQSRFHDQAAELERLTGLTLAFGRAMGNRRSEYGNAILTPGRVSDVQVEVLPGRGEPRSLLSATVDVDGLQLRAYVTHLVAWGRLGSRTRLMQAEAVAKLTSQSDLPFILTGDFNSDPRSEELSVFRDATFVSSCFVDTVVTHRATKKCLDYIFVDPRWQIRSAEVLQRGPSDHWPLVAEIDLASRT